MSNLQSQDPPNKVPETQADRRKRFLEEAVGVVCKDRQTNYGSPEDNFRNIADITNVLLRQKLKEPLDALDVTKIMLAVKMSRLITSPLHRDNWIDIAGYAACGGGIAESAKEEF